MKEYGLTKSTAKPPEVEVLETKVFVASDIQEIEEVVEEEKVISYEFNLTEYEKDEYIELMQAQSNELKESLTDTQMALVEVYELIGG